MEKNPNGNLDDSDGRIHEEALLENSKSTEDEDYIRRIHATSDTQEIYGMLWSAAVRGRQSPGIDKILLALAEKCPEGILSFAERFLNEPYAEEVLTRAAERNPKAAIYYAIHYANQQWAKAIVKSAAKKEPRLAVWLSVGYIDTSYGEAIILEALQELEGQQAMREFEKYALQIKKMGRIQFHKNDEFDYNASDFLAIVARFGTTRSSKQMAIRKLAQFRDEQTLIEILEKEQYFPSATERGEPLAPIIQRALKKVRTPESKFSQVPKSIGNVFQKIKRKIAIIYNKG